MSSVRLSSEHYGEHAQQNLDIFTPAAGVERGVPLLICVHGGAWRVGDKSETRALLTRIVEKTSLAAASINYRLSAHPDPNRAAQHAKHPQHVEDVTRGILYLLTERKDRPWGDLQTARLIVGGHSVGSFICATLLLDQRPSAFLRSPVVTQLKNRIVGLVSSEGVLDVADWLEEYPSYSFFTDNAFVGNEAAEHNAQRFDHRGRILKVLISSAVEDELLSPRSAKHFTRRLYELSGKGSWTGETNFSGNGLDVKLDLESVHGKHDDVLQGTELPALISEWLRRSGFVEEG